MRDYQDSEILICLLTMIPDADGRTEKTLCRKMLKYGCLRSDSIISMELFAPFLRDEAHVRRLHWLLGQKQAVLQKLFFLAEKQITVLTRLSPEYPDVIRSKMGERAPLLLFCSGNLSLFQRPCISLVGSRKLTKAGRFFAEEAGRQIALQGYVYCSGGANGADTAGFMAAVREGAAILFLPDSLEEEMSSARYRSLAEQGKLLLVSEDGSDLTFSAARALSRNHLIHAMGIRTLVAQTGVGKGGTWNGTVDNLKHHYSPVFVCADHADSAGADALAALGAVPVHVSELQNLNALTDAQLSLNNK